jgi:hypothetical protein
MNNSNGVNNFSWTKAFGFGIAIWLIMFLVAAVLVSGMGIALGSGLWLVLAVLAGIISYSFALGVDSESYGEALGYGAIWAAVGIILDAIISYRFQSNIFSQWQYYLAYALVLLAPWFEYEMQGSGAHPKPV